MFIFQNPTLISIINKKKCGSLLGNLIAKSNTSKSISPQLFWETKEFCYPGDFKYQHDGFTKSQIDIVGHDISSIFPKSAIPFLIFESKRWFSIEALVDSPQLTNMTQSVGLEVVFKSKNEEIYKMSKDRYYILFVKPISEMKSANAYYDFNGHDKKFVEGKYWLSLSEIKL